MTPDDPATAGMAPHAPVAGRLAPLLPAIVSSILPVFLVGALVGPMGDELGYRETTAGVLMAAFFAVSALVARRAGSIADSIGPITALQLGLAGSAVVAAVIAVAADSAVLLGATMMIGGGCNALTQVAANVYLARYLPVHRHGVAFAVKQSANPGGAMVAGVLLPSLVLNLGWRSAFVVAAVGSGGSAWALASARSWPVVPGSGGPPSPPDTGGSSSDPNPTIDASSGGRRDRALLLVAASAAFGSASAVALGGFFVESARDAGVGLGAAGLAASLGSATAIAGRLVVGVRADRVQADPRRILGWIAAMLVTGSAALLLCGVRAPWAQWLALPLAYGAGWAWPGVFNLAVVRARPDQPGRATGVSQTGIYVGTTVGPLVLGAVSERAGYQVTWSLAAGLACVGAAGMIAARSRLVGREGTDDGGPGQRLAPRTSAGLRVGDDGVAP
ncbi:MAG: MFS transporter [Microthrixaceae bacterium]